MWYTDTASCAYVSLVQLRVCINTIRWPTILSRRSGRKRRPHVRVRKPKVFVSRIHQSSNFSTDSLKEIVGRREAYYDLLESWWYLNVKYRLNGWREMSQSETKWGIGLWLCIEHCDKSDFVYRKRMAWNYWKSNVRIQMILSQVRAHKIKKTCSLSVGSRHQLIIIMLNNKMCS